MVAGLPAEYPLHMQHWVAHLGPPILIRMGCIRVRPLTGGIYAWKDAGFDVEAMSESGAEAGAAVSHVAT